MAKRQIVQGATSEILEVFIQDSTSTTGAGLTGLTNASAGLTCYYHINTAASAVAVSLASMTVGTFTSSGFKEVDSANMPGIYQLCLPNAAYASGKSVSAFLKGATNMVPLALEIEITQTNNQDAVRGGMTALPNANAAAANGLPTSGSGSNQILLSSGLVRLTTAGAGDIWDTVLASHLTAGSTGFALNAAGSAGDPWATAVPGAYSAGQAGYVLGTNLNATVSSRSTYAGGAVASVTGNVGGNVTGSVGSVTAGVTLTSGERTSVADAVLTRDFGSVSPQPALNERNALQALRFLRNAWSVAVATLTVFAEDDTTAAWTSNLTLNSGANPITGSDPT